MSSSRNKSPELPMLDVSDAAKALGCCEQTVRRMRIRGELIGYTRKGWRGYYFLPSEVKKLAVTYYPSAPQSEA